MTNFYVKNLWRISFLKNSCFYYPKNHKDITTAEPGLLVYIAT